MNVRLALEFRFEAAHRLPRVAPDHKCARLHGHSFKVEIAVDGPVDPDTGWLVDYQVIQDAWAPLQEKLDHHYLNEIPGLENPTSENLARFVWDALRPSVEGLARVTIFETCVARCEYEGR